MSAASLLGLIALVIGLAVVAEIIGDRFGVPNFLFFILGGLVIGPAGLNLLNHKVFGESLGVVIGLGVAIIIFHSGSGITREALDTAPRIVFSLVTIGVITTFLGTAAVTYLVMNVSVGLALLIGGLLVATGSTVIEPLLAAVPVRERLAYTLDIEATVTEVTAGILAVTVFNAFRLGNPDSHEIALKFGRTLVIGIVVGAAIAGVVWGLYKKPIHAPQGAPKHASQLYLATAIMTYAIAENIAHEAGIAAVATGGILLGNADLPYQEHITDLEEDFTTFIIAFIFVILASFVEPEWLATVGLEGFIVAVAVIVVIRPLAVFLSTVTSVFSFREKLFLGTASPRGIIPAGVATLLAISIQGTNPTGAAYITGTVLFTILVSTAIEGLFAGRIAERLGLLIDTTVIVGGGRLGLALANQYAERGERVVLVDIDQQTVERGRTAGFPVYHGNGTDEDVLRDAHTGGANKVVAATDDDAANREIAQLARSEFDVETVLTRVNHQENRAMFEDLDVELLTGSQLDLWALDYLTVESVPDWFDALTRTGGVESISVTDGFEMTIGDLDQSLPDRSFVVALTRDERTWIPDRTELIEDGDRLTLIGRSAAVEEATSHLTSLLNKEDINVQPSDDIDN